jgi:nicotinamidase/pyrazinamidase
VYATRDWHPPDHCSFTSRGGPWPVHCVAGTAGAAFAPSLRLPATASTISKATQRDHEAYSAFQGTDLADRLQGAGIERVFIGGLATDYCVLDSVRDALKLGFDACVLVECIRAVDARPGDGERAEAEMFRLGARAVRLADIGA